MATDLLFAGVPTADLESTLTWYDALLRRPADVIVNDDEVMWRICDGGWLYLVQDPSRAGHALVTMAVSDLDQVVGEVAGRVDPIERSLALRGLVERMPVLAWQDLAHPDHQMSTWTEASVGDTDPSG